VGSKGGEVSNMEEKKVAQKKDPFKLHHKKGARKTGEPEKSKKMVTITEKVRPNTRGGSTGRGAPEGD